MAEIQLKSVTKRFGEFQAVDSVDMTVADGEVLCLLGPSGCGKTTTLRMIAGLEDATSGDIWLGGVRVNDLSPSARDIAMVFQFYALYPSLTVRENLTFPLKAVRLEAAEIERRVSHVANALDLTGVLERRPGRLAEGEKQRVAVGRAIVREPNCFLFDEPLSRLDIVVRQEMRGKIKEILADLSCPTVIVTHDQLEALTMADRIAVMRDGRIEQVATPHEIFTKPENVFVASFIGTPQMNFLTGRRLNGREDAPRLQVADQEVLIPLGRTLDQLPADGAKLTVGVRPRAFELASESSEETYSAKVDLIEPMGAETLLHLRDGVGDLRIVIERGASAKVGETVHLRCKPGQVHLFGEDGRRVH